VLTASSDGSARVWDAQTGEPLTPPLKHAQQVVQASFSADGRAVVTASFDGTARIWPLHRDGRPVSELIQLARMLSAHEIHPTGGTVPMEPAALRSAWQALRKR
jgi:WD40 repeat protein